MAGAKIRDGVHKTYYPNGQLKSEAIYKDGKLNGLKKTYHEDGKLDVEEYYRNDKLHGTHTLYDRETGKPKFVAIFADGVVQSAKLYDPKRGTAFEVDYKKGKRNGALRKTKMKPEDAKPSTKEHKNAVIDNSDMLSMTRTWVDKDGFLKENILPIKFLPQEFVRAIIKDKRTIRDHAVRRTSATRDQMEMARTLALDSIPEIEKNYHQAGKKQEELMSKGDWQSPAFDRTCKDISINSGAATWVFDILTVAGKPEDAEALIKMAYRDTEFRYQMIDTAAIIEARLGILNQGAVIKILNSISNENERKSSLLAARILTSYGFWEGLPLLLKQLESSSDTIETSDAAEALLSSDDPRVITAMRSVLRTFLEEKKRIDNEHGSRPNKQYPYYLHTASGYALLNFVAFGEESDLEQIVKLPLTNRHLEVIFPITANPQDILGPLIGKTYQSQLAAKLYPAIKLRPEEQAEALHTQLLNILINNYLPKLDPYVREYKYARIGVNSEYNPRISFLRPNTTVANMVGEENEKFLTDDMTWIPRPWAIKFLVREFIKGKYSNAKYLDYLPHEELTRVLKEENIDENQTPYIDLYLAYHRVASRLFQIYNPYPQGAEYRAFVLCNKTNPYGVVSGCMAIRPFWQNSNKLRFEITLRFVTVGEKGLAAAMSDPDDPTISSYVGKTGRNLISDVQLYRLHDEITVRDKGTNENRVLVFETDVIKKDLSNLTFHLEIKLFESRWPVDIALYTSSLSRN